MTKNNAKQKDDLELIEGVFLKELDNRFRCVVKVGSDTFTCYVPSSCRLSNLINLEGKKVLLTPTLTPTATAKYSLFAVQHKRSYILLNSSIANKAVKMNIASRRFSYLSDRNTIIAEHSVNGYKADLFIEDTGSIIEIKSIISQDSEAIFPAVFSARANRQLKELSVFLEQGINVYFYIISLSPYLKSVRINKEMVSFYESFLHCLHLGMRTAAYTCRLRESKLTLEKEIPIII